MRGLELDPDDLLRRKIVMGLKGRGRFAFAGARAAVGIEAPVFVADESKRLSPLAAHGLVRRRDDAVEVTAAGWHVVRAAAMAFDRCIEHGSTARERFSRVL